MGEGVARFDDLAAARSTRVAGGRVSRWRWEHTAEGVRWCQSSMSEQQVVQSARDWAWEHSQHGRLAAQYVCREAGRNQWPSLPPRSRPVMRVRTCTTAAGATERRWWVGQGMQYM